jgi:hypothetical protein
VSDLSDDIESEISKVVSLIDHPVNEIHEQAIKLAGELCRIMKYKDMILSEGGLQKISNSLNAGRLFCINSCVKALANICKYKLIPSYESFEPCIDKILNQLFTVEDKDTLKDLLFTISCLTDIYEITCMKLKHINAIPRLVILLE